VIIRDPLTGAVVIDRGDHARLKIGPVLDEAGNARDLTGGSFLLTCKKSIDDPIGAAKFQKSSGLSEFDLSQIAQGIVYALLVPNDTLSLDGVHVYDCQTVLGGKTETIQPAATLEVRKDVTTTGSVPAPAAVGSKFPWIAFEGNLYGKDESDGKWVKFRLFNRNFEYVSESTNEPPF